MCNAWQEAASHAEGLDTECVKVFVYHPLKVIEIFDIEGRQSTDHPDGTPAVQWFNPCGSPLEIRHYRNGLRHGLSTKYDRSGLRRRVSHWVDGKLCDSPEGRPAVVELWVGGTTKLITYKTDGQPSTPGANTPALQRFHPDGRLFGGGSYRNGDGEIVWRDAPTGDAAEWIRSIARAETERLGGADVSIDHDAMTIVVSSDGHHR